MDVSCPHCKTMLEVRKDEIGTEGKCPACGKSFTIKDVPSRIPVPARVGKLRKFVGVLNVFRLLAKRKRGRTGEKREIAPSKSSHTLVGVCRVAAVLLIILLLAGNLAISCVALMRDDKRAEDNANLNKMLMRTLGNIKSEVSSIEFDAGRIMADVGNIRIDIGAITKDVGRIDTNVRDTIMEVRNMKNDISSIESDLRKIRNNVDSIESDVGSIKREVEGTIDVRIK